MLVEHVGPFHAGEHIFREGDPFSAIAAVRAGTVKTRVVDEDGREQVLGFYLPGEVIGLNAIYAEHYPCDAVALDTAYCCAASRSRDGRAGHRALPGLQQHLFRLLSPGHRQRRAARRRLQRRRAHGRVPGRAVAPLRRARVLATRST